MGFSLHVATTYDVSYSGSPSGLGWEQYEFGKLLNALGVEYSPDNDGWGMPDDCECDVDKWKEGIKTLREFPNISNKDLDAEEIQDRLNAFEGYTVYEIIEFMEQCLKAGDTRDGYLHLSWW